MTASQETAFKHMRDIRKSDLVLLAPQESQDKTIKVTKASRNKRLCVNRSSAE